MNYIKDVPTRVDTSAIEGFEGSQNLYNAIIEISNGDNIKYEVHPSGKYLTAVRTLVPIFKYPFSYGFIPRTLAEDGDGLDVIVVTPEPIAHLTVMEVKVLGFIPTIDKGVEDVKILAVPAYSMLKKVSMEKVMAFLKTYKYPHNEDTQVGEYVANVEQAEGIIARCVDRFEAEELKVLPVQSVVEEGKEAETAEAESVPTENPVPVEEPVIPQAPPEPELPLGAIRIVPSFIKAVEPTAKEATVSTVVDEQPVESIPAIEETKPAVDADAPSVDSVGQNTSVEEVAGETSPTFREQGEEVVSQPAETEVKNIDSGWLT